MGKNYNHLKQRAKNRNRTGINIKYECGLHSDFAGVTAINF